MTADNLTPEQVAEVYAALDRLVARGFLDSYRRADATGYMEVQLSERTARAARAGDFDGLVKLGDAMQAAREATS